MKKYLSLLLALLLCTGMAVPASAAGFSDVPGGHYAAASIDYCVAKGIASGYSDGTFRPSGSVTRAQFCVMLSRAFYPKETEERIPKKDAVEAWFSPNTRVLSTAGVLRNTPFSSTYGARETMDVPISRYEMAQLMANIMAAGGKAAAASEKAAVQGKIKDWASVPEIYRDAVAACYARGILGGLSDGTFGGSGAMNRAQGCVVIDRLSKQVQSPGKLTPEAPAQAAAVSPMSSNNIALRDYEFYSSKPMRSYLFANDKGGVTRVENLTVEEYDSSFRMLNSRKIPKELPVLGGFYAGSQYNFFIFGQNNNAESDRVEVFRVVKYSKDWQRLGQASVYGENTTVPFRSGCLRCEELNGFLYIHTSHQMYTYNDGKRHQSNFTIVVEESSMKHQIMDFFYVSHSFDQYILADQQGNLAALDLGDAYPYRGIVLHRIPNVLTRCRTYNALTVEQAEAYGRDYVVKSIHDIPGEKGENYTGVRLGGFEETTSGYVSAYTVSSNMTGPRTVYLGYTDKASLTNRETALAAPMNASAPVLVSTGLNSGYVLWNEGDQSFSGDTLYYVTYSDGGVIGTVRTAKASLSDCRPVVYNGKVVWYAAENSAPVFYMLDESGVTSVKAASASGAFAAAGPSADSVPKANTPPSTKTVFDGEEDDPEAGQIIETPLAEFIGIKDPETNKYCSICGSLLWDAAKNDFKAGMWSSEYQYGICYSCEGTPAARAFEANYR